MSSYEQINIHTQFWKLLMSTFQQFGSPGTAASPLKTFSFKMGKWLLWTLGVVAAGANTDV